MHRRKMDVLTVAWIQDLCSENKKLKRKLETAESSVKILNRLCRLMRCTTDSDAFNLGILRRANTKLRKENESLNQEVTSLKTKLGTLTKFDSGGGGGVGLSSTSDSSSSSSDDDDDIRSPPRKRQRIEVEWSDSDIDTFPSISINLDTSSSSGEEPIRTFPTKMQMINRKLTRSKKQQDLQERFEGDDDEGTSTSDSDETSGLITGSSDEEATAAASPKSLMPKRIANRSEIVMNKLKANIQKQKELEESMNRFSSLNRKSDSSSLVQYSSSSEDDDIIIIPESEIENEVPESSISVIQLDTTSDSDAHTSSESEHEYGKYNKSLASKLVKSYQTHVSGNGKRPMMSNADCLIINDVRGQVRPPSPTTMPTEGTSSHHTHDHGQNSSSSSSSLLVEKPESKKSSQKNKGNGVTVSVNHERRVTRSSVSVKDTVTATDNSPNPNKSNSSLTSDSEEEEDEIAKILSVRQEKNEEREFLIQWKGRDAKDATWEVEGELEGAEDMIKEFYENYKAGRGRGRKIDQSDRIQLWCTCRQPHDNRFMICCDRCEEWFHGKCVGVTKTQGKVMETMSTAWHCPSCKQIIKAKGDAEFKKYVKTRASSEGGARPSTSASAPKNWGVKSKQDQC